MALLLLGMGYGSVSIAPQFIPEIKYAVCRTTLERARALVVDALAEGTSEGVRCVLDGIRDELYRAGNARGTA